MLQAAQVDIHAYATLLSDFWDGMRHVLLCHIHVPGRCGPACAGDGLRVAEVGRPRAARVRERASALLKTTRYACQRPNCDDHRPGSLPHSHPDGI